MNLLLIEDEVRVADFILRGLRAEGWIVTHVPDAEAGLELVLRDRFDVILLDLMLPGISGQDFCRKVRSRDDHTPIREERHRLGCVDDRAHLVLVAVELVDHQAAIAIADELRHELLGTGPEQCLVVTRQQPNSHDGHDA